MVQTGVRMFGYLWTGPVRFEIIDLNITAAVALGFSRRIDARPLTDNDDKRVDLVFRVTDVYRTINGKWLIIHEHMSFPVAPATGKSGLRLRGDHLRTCTPGVGRSPRRALEWRTAP